MSEKESMEIKIALIQERVTSDRRNHAIQFKNMNEQLTYIINKLDHSHSESEADRLQLASLIPQLKESLLLSKDNQKKIIDYKKKMLFWELFQEWKHVPFWTFIALFIIVVREQLIVLFNSFLNKFTGN